jgi:hypothetical protein
MPLNYTHYSEYEMKCQAFFVQGFGVEWILSPKPAFLKNGSGPGIFTK